MRPGRLGTPHRAPADSLGLVVDLVLAGHGVSLLPSDKVEARQVRTVALDLADTRRRMWSTVRAGTQQWPANHAVIDHIRAAITGQAPDRVPGSDAGGPPPSG